MQTLWFTYLFIVHTGTALFCLSYDFAGSYMKRMSSIELHVIQVIKLTI